MTNLNPVMSMAQNTTCSIIGNLSNASLEMISNHPKDTSTAIVGSALAILAGRVFKGTPSTRMAALLIAVLGAAPYGVELANVRICNAEDKLDASFAKIDDFYADILGRTATRLEEAYYELSNTIANLYQQNIG